MNTQVSIAKAWVAGIAFIAVVPAMAAGHAAGHHTVAKGLAAAYPWAFKDGNVTSKSFAITTAQEIAQKAGYSMVPGNEAMAAWKASRGEPKFGRTPSSATLRAYGKSVHAAVVLYGSVAWHTRSVWVNAGPKTISTATANVYVFDVRSGRTVFRSQGVTGRNDEKTLVLKVVADVLVTPLVTAVSGGPATPREQRAVQIALGRAYRGWVARSR